MMNSEHVDKKVQKYISENCLRLNPVEKKLVETTTKQCAQPLTDLCHVECSKLMSVLVKIANPRKILEIGTLNGLTTLNMSLALPSDAQIITLTTQEREKNIASIKNVWKEAGVDQKVILI
jgi:caffeoyl-CoA O-methyltransferase